MTHKIFRSVFLSALAALALSYLLFFGVLYSYFDSLSMRQLKDETALAAQGVETEGSRYLEGLVPDGCRITWISADGTVLYESSRTAADQMENHLGREEVQKALAEGYGQSRRYSSTLMENSLYAARLLSDGTVLRLSVTQNSVFGIMLGMMQPVCIVLLLAALFSALLAYRFSRKVVKPLNDIDLDHPEEVEGYDELSPLLKRIRLQQNELGIREQELAGKQEELETILENMTEGMILLDADGKIISINAAASGIIGARGIGVGESILKATRNMTFQNAINKGLSGANTEELASFGTGQYQLRVSPVIKENRVRGVVAALFDVTEKVQAEEMRREFSANVSHELKTPLHVISGCAELMKNGMVQEQDIPAFSEKIYGEAQRTIQLVEDIISLSHLDEGAEDMKFEKTDLYEIACKAGSTLQEKAEKAEVSLTVTGEPAGMEGIPVLLETMVQNLCDNAVKYNRPGGKVTVRVEKEDKSAVLTVADTGIGIPEADQKRIFERFYRVDKSHSRAVGGTGLGLSIVKHAVMIHHGTISLNSRPGEGTTIKVKLPLQSDGNRNKCNKGFQAGFI